MKPIILNCIQRSVNFKDKITKRYITEDVSDSDCADESIYQVFPFCNNFTNFLSYSFLSVL